MSVIHIYIWVIITIVIVTVVFFLLIRSLLKRRINSILENFRGRAIRKVERSANFFGIESEGMTQIRGNGVLLLTDEEIYFQMWIPNRELKIGRDRISGTEIVNAHLGRTRLRPLLKVNFMNRRGEKDSVAWLVNQPREWVSEIEGVFD